MAVTLTERVDSRRRGLDWADFIYILTGTSDDLTAKTLIENSTASTYDGLTRQTIALEPEWVDTATHDGRWVATIHYGIKPPVDIGDTTFSFDTTGGTQHITQSLGTVQTAAAPGWSAPSLKGVIGLTHNSVEGVDIVCPVFNFSLRRRVPIAQWTAAYVAALYQLTGKVNNSGLAITIADDQYTFAAGEVLFLGASGDESTSNEYVDVTLRFAASPNRTGIVIGQIPPVDKKGWEYLWVRYEDGTDANGLVKIPVAAYVEKVYPDGDFTVLGSV